MSSSKAFGDPCCHCKSNWVISPAVDSKISAPLRDKGLGGSQFSSFYKGSIAEFRNHKSRFECFAVPASERGRAIIGSLDKLQDRLIRRRGISDSFVRKNELVQLAVIVRRLRLHAGFFKSAQVQGPRTSKTSVPRVCRFPARTHG